MKKFFILFLCSFSLLICINNNSVYAMPYYNLSPKELEIRSNFTTYFSTSSDERKNNIFLASKKINNTFLDVNEEFSFNKTVGERSEKNGFKKATIIKNGEYIEGVGGGICQVSTTLYNAVLLADLTISEYHPHSLPVSYIEPSFDAMINSGSADFRFVNNTKNPMIIYSSYTENSITFTIYGEPLDYEIKRESKVVEKIPFETEYRIDEKNEYNLTNCDESIIQYGKEGIKSVGYIIKIDKNNKQTKKIIRKNTYKPTKKIIIKNK